MLKKEFNQFYSSKQFAQAIGVHKNTVIRWDRDGRLHPHHKDKHGYRYYTQEQVDEFLKGGI
ncbi:MAG: MerR family transcriptional regulator [Lachnospiraceae bacterium]|nr:MerR family transcriptional regulator [Lachnospiraceae bacterium]